MPVTLPPEVCADLVEEAHVGLCVIQDDRIVYGNRWLRTFDGCPAGAAYPIDVSAVMHPDDRALVARQIQLRLAGGEAPPSFAARLVAPDGSLHEVEIFTRSIVYQGRAAIQATLVESSARAARELDLMDRVSRLEESSRLNLLFADILSHDLMNPVWIAENYLRLVADGGVPEGKLVFYEGMRGALAKARGILADARTYLKCQGHVAVASERVEIVPLVQDVVQRLRPLWEERSQKVTLSLAPEAVVNGSPLLREVVWQLLANAIKFAPPGSPIEVVASAGPRVRFEVRDRGPGVPERDRERIFRRYKNLEKGPVTGIGLGLAIARRIAELHAGKVWVEGNPGGGSIFVAEFLAAGC